jgi:hypothetical protein
MPQQDLRSAVTQIVYRVRVLTGEAARLRMLGTLRGGCKQPFLSLSGDTKKKLFICCFCVVGTTPGW